MTPGVTPSLLSRPRRLQVGDLRRFVAPTEKKLAELLSSDPSGHDAALVMLGGIVFHEAIEAQWSFRRLEGCSNMQPLVEAVCAEVTGRLTEEERSAATPLPGNELGPEMAR